jgi:hypothetical protein
MPNNSKAVAAAVNLIMSLLLSGFVQLLLIPWPDSRLAERVTRLIQQHFKASK